MTSNYTRVQTASAGRLRQRESTSASRSTWLQRTGWTEWPTRRVRQSSSPEWRSRQSDFIESPNQAEHLTIRAPQHYSQRIRFSGVGWEAGSTQRSDSAGRNPYLNPCRGWGW